ncbi:hypothetical protein J2Z21_000953 [Streptomyces griseochromogenes]|uniref:Uncharacterized protein n=1 Tax=Streptomyces griseochromogenes TaxID=68214 RepID=A0ABS4LKV4_9ACTN|nr:hypothetical protein [Streptomyces griseochromogenes]MBP2048029.1 hypothetical protein [Streptomyces griseochromogenes]
MRPTGRLLATLATGALPLAAGEYLGDLGHRHLHSRSAELARPSPAGHGDLPERGRGVL